MCGEAPDGVAGYVGCLRVVEGEEVVGYVGEPEVRVQFQEFSFDCAYQVILLTYVGR